MTPLIPIFGAVAVAAVFGGADNPLRGWRRRRGLRGMSYTRNTPEWFVSISPVKGGVVLRRVSRAVTKRETPRGGVIDVPLTQHRWKFARPGEAADFDRKITFGGGRPPGKSKAFFRIQGREAFRRGVPYSPAPYAGWQGAAWRVGWNEAAEIHHERIVLGGFGLDNAQKFTMSRAERWANHNRFVQNPRDTPAYYDAHFDGGF